MLHQITDVDLQQYAHTLEKLVPRGCLNATDRRLSLLGEKSPGYSYVSYAALRMCEALVSPRIFFLLRNPVTRAYSAFHHTRSDVRWMFPNISFDPDGFNRLVLGAGMTGRQVTILRMFAKYMRQIGTTFSHTLGV